MNAVAQFIILILRITVVVTVRKASGGAGTTFTFLCGRAGDRSGCKTFSYDYLILLHCSWHLPHSAVLVDDELYIYGLLV